MKTPKLCINPESLPPPSGPYSQLVRKGNMIFLAGMVPFDINRNVVGDDIRTQTRQAIQNMIAALEAANASLNDICSVTGLLANLDRDFPGYNEVYAEFFLSGQPARATVGVTLGGFLVELQAIAVVD